MLSMKKTEVYSWRMRPELKQMLEAVAREQGCSLAELLDRVVEEWLADFRQADAEAQSRLHAAAARCFGVTHGGDPHGSAKVSDRVRARLRQPHRPK